MSKTVVRCHKCRLEVEIELLAEILPIVSFRMHEMKQRCQFASEPSYGSNCPYRDEAAQGG